MILYGQDEIAIVEADPLAVVLHERMFLLVSRYLNAQKPLHIGSGMIRPDLIGIILPKRSPLRKPFNIM